MHATKAALVSFWIGLAYAQQTGFASGLIAYDFSTFNGTISFQSVVKFGIVGASCQTEQTVVKSPIAPLNQGLTAVFRGPLSLKQFAVYHLENDIKAAKVPTRVNGAELRRHGLHHAVFHQRFHAKGPLHRRNCGDLVTAMINDEVVSFVDDWDCVITSTSPQPSRSTSRTAGEKTSSDANLGGTVTSTGATEVLEPQPSSDTMSMSQGDHTASWRRTAYYSALQPPRSHNLTFLYPVEYSHTDFLPSTGETSGQPAASPELLGDVLIPDNSRFYVASDIPMVQSAAPQNKAYQGFRGNKIILVEISMPLSGLRDQSPYPDQPAFWLLNEQLPNVDDASQCSCWASGCGEFDVSEIIETGAEVGYSALHMGQQYCGGADNGFKRAVNDTQKLAVIIQAGSDGATSIVRALELDKWYIFADKIEDRDFKDWVNRPLLDGDIGKLLFGEACPDVSKIHFRRM